MKERQDELLAEARERAKVLALPGPTPEVREAVRPKATVKAYIDEPEAQERERDDAQVPTAIGSS